MNAIRPAAPAAVEWITRTLEDAGYETWTVGGAIRDALLGRPSGDWDLATRAAPGEVRRLFKRTVPIGIEHGTVGVLARDGVLYEITTFRKDVETDGRHAVVEFAESIEDDLARRDFTINAIAWHALREEYNDPFGGAGDLDAHVLRTVGAAGDRFKEDYLRILRALRFAGRFSLEIDAETWTALCALVDHLTSLSLERIREELLKVLAADPHPTRSLDLYAASGALRVLYPELAELDASRWGGTLRTLERLPTQRPHVRLAALLRPLAAEATASLLLRLRLSNALVDETARLAAADPLPRPDASETDFRRWLSRNGAERLTAVARLELACARGAADGEVLSENTGDATSESDGGASSESGDIVTSWRRARAVRRSGAPLTVSDLEIDGRRLIGLGMRPGPGFGEILEALLDWVLDDPARNERALLESHALELSHEREGRDPGAPDV